jgi:hypothetical protein
MPPVSSIPALTLWQPWASLIARGLKRYETRSWAPPASLIGQRLAIHAGTHKTTTGEVPEGLGLLLFDEDIDLAHLPTGAVIATARLVAAHRTEERRPFVSWVEDDVGDWSPGRWAWELNDVVEFERPVPWCDGQRLWSWGPDATCLVCGGQGPPVYGVHVCSNDICRYRAQKAGMLV